MGDFLSFLFLGILLFFHELGHFITAGLLDCPLDKIYFYPFGGISKFQIDMNKPLKEEFLILFMGPFIQMLTYLLIKQLPLTEDHLILLKQINYGLLLFNLLPIYPLDGGRMFLLILEKFFSFYHSYQIIFTLSSMFIVFFWFLFLQTKKLQYLFVFLLLFCTLWNEMKKFPFYFEKFLIERLLEKYTFRKVKFVKSIYQFKRSYLHFLQKEGKCLKENEFLQEKFLKKS